MTVTYAIEGAVTPDGVTVTAEITGVSARLAVSPGDMGSASTVFFGPVVAENGVAKLVAFGLDPESDYAWQVEEDGVLDSDWAGSFTTLRPYGSTGTHTTAWTSCAGAGPTLPGAVVEDRVSDHPAYDAIREHALSPVLAVDLGDKHYRDIGSGTHSPEPYDEVDYRDAFRDCWTFNETLGSDARQGKLYRRVPIAYVWDNHDYSFSVGSSTDADKTAPARDAACRVYRERIPHYPLPETEDTGGIYQTFVIDRVRYILLDVRSYREPNLNPDGPGHTMLGQRQREWLQELLATATEQFLVLGSAGQWITRPTESDTWAKFEYEQGEIVTWLGDGGWLDRMCIVTGSDHAIGIDSGAGNPMGGCPVFLFSSMDSSPSAQKDIYDQGHYPGKGQYGTLTINDTGDQITVTGIGWNETNLIVSYSWSVSADEPAPPPPEPTPLPDDTPATATAVVQWAAFDASTGDILGWLPGLTGGIERQLSAYSTSSLTLPAPLWGQLALGPLAPVVTRPIRTWLCCIINDKPASLGYIVKVQDSVGVTMGISAASIEAMLDNLYVTDQTYRNTDEAAIVQGLLQPAMESGIHMVLDCPPTGTLRDRTYHGTDDATIYKRLQELTDVEGGPEWTIVPEWDIPNRRIVAVFRLRPRIGKTVPSVEFSTTGQTKARWTRTRDFSRGRFATRVMAYSSGEGEDRPQSAVHVATSLESAGWPRIEHRFSPSSSITTPAVLDAHASNALRQIQHGTTSVEITVRRDAEPGRWGVDWDIGDVVKWDLRGHTEPNGWLGRGRVIGWRMAVASGDITPVIIMED